MPYLKSFSARYADEKTILDQLKMIFPTTNVGVIVSPRLQVAV